MQLVNRSEGESGMPLVSILIALYNAEIFLPHLINSLSKTTYENIEIIIVDDCSTDKTDEICKSWGLNHSEIRFYRNSENLGIFPTYRRLLQFAKGKYVIWQDQDDFRDETFIEKAVVILEQNPNYVLCHCLSLVSVGETSVHFTSMDAISGDKKVISRYWNMLRNFSDIPIYGLISKSALAQTFGWRDEIGSCNILLFELLLVGKFTFVDELLFYYNGKGFAQRPKIFEERIRSVKSAKSKMHLPPWFTITRSQISSVWTIRNSPLSKIGISGALVTHFLVSSGAKSLYRILPGQIRSHIRDFFGRFVISRGDIHQIVSRDKFPEIYSPDFPLH